ncbi:MAG: rhomboid family intramembrane serine protease [Chromatiales bacterium]|jgi:membrane associated rhomboid family serine protease
MTEPEAQAERDAGRLRRAFLAVLAFTAVLWLIQIAAMLAGWDLARFGVYPRRMQGLPGVLVAPLIHGSAVHLFFNTGPLLVLGTALLYGYPRASRIVVPTLYLGSGLAVWLLARPAYHLGASGLCFGMLSFVFTMGVLRWDRRAIALSMVVFFLYGGMIWGVLPLRPGVSFESHLAGALLGLGLAVALRHRDPAPPRRTYDWEDGERDAEDRE